MKAIFQIVIYHIEKPLGRNNLIAPLKGIEKDDGRKEEKNNMKAYVGKVEDTQSSLSYRLSPLVSDFKTMWSKTNSQLDTLTSI